MTSEEREKIDKMSQIEMARLYRFAPSGHPYFVSGTVISTYFLKRFKEKGGFNSQISKTIGWK